MVKPSLGNPLSEYERLKGIISLTGWLRFVGMVVDDTYDSEHLSEWVDYLQWCNPKKGR